MTARSSLFKGATVVLTGLLSLALFTGCTVNLPFNSRLAFSSIKEIQQELPKQDIKIYIVWEPSSFPSRIDVQGSSGFVGGGSRTRIPTGVGLAARIEEAVSLIVDFDARGMPLTITVEQAQSEFEYSAGFFNITPAIDTADVVFKATFTIGDITWRNEYTSHFYDPTIGGTSQTMILEQAWDDIAVQVAKDVAVHVRDLSSNTP